MSEQPPGWVNSSVSWGQDLRQQLHISRARVLRDVTLPANCLHVKLALGCKTVAEGVSGGPLYPFVSSHPQEPPSLCTAQRRSTREEYPLGDNFKTNFCLTSPVTHRVNTFLKKKSSISVYLKNVCLFDARLSGTTAVTPLRALANLTRLVWIL